MFTYILGTIIIICAFVVGTAHIMMGDESKWIFLAWLFVVILSRLEIMGREYINRN